MGEIVAKGAAEIAAFMSRIQHGNHNNAMMIDRHVEAANYRLAVVASDAAVSIAATHRAIQQALEKEGRG